MEVIIELISRNNKVQSLHKLSGDSITIGRAYDNDLVLQEEHTSPYHAEITQSESGGLLLIDQNSVNGIRDRKNNKLGSHIKLNSGDVITIGKHLVRVLLPNHPVINAKRLNVFEDITRNMNHWYLALLAAFLFFVNISLDSYFTAVEEIIWSKLSAKALLITIGIMVVPLLITLSARIFKKDVKFFAAVVFSYSMFVIWQLISAIGKVLLFNWGDAGVVILGADIIEFVLMIVFFWGSFYLASSMSLQRITLVSSLLVVSIVALFYLSSQSDGKVQPYPTHYAVVLPSNMLVSQAISSEQYTENTNSLFDLASTEAEKRNKEANDQHQ